MNEIPRDCDMWVEAFEAKFYIKLRASLLRERTGINCLVIVWSVFLSAAAKTVLQQTQILVQAIVIFLAKLGVSAGGKEISSRLIE